MAIKAKDIHPGDRFFFKFGEWETAGTVVAPHRTYEEMSSVWFKPDDGFEIPSHWDFMDDRKDAFSTDIYHLFELQVSDWQIDCSDLSSLL